MLVACYATCGLHNLNLARMFWLAMKTIWRQKRQQQQQGLSRLVGQLEGSSQRRPQLVVVEWRQTRLGIATTDATGVSSEEANAGGAGRRRLSLQESRQEKRQATQVRRRPVSGAQSSGWCRPV